MELLRYVFHLGIIFIIFEVLWHLFLGAWRLLFPPQKGMVVGKILTRALTYYLLAALSALKTLDFIPAPAADLRTIGLSLIGAAVLYSYLTGKLKRSEFKLRINQQAFSPEDPRILKFSGILTVLAVIAFVAFITTPDLATNPVTLWLKNAITSIYNTPVIGWIFGFAGVFFLISSISKGFKITNSLFSGFGNFFSGQSKAGEQEAKKSNDDFDDYELIENEKLEE